MTFEPKRPGTAVTRLPGRVARRLESTLRAGSHSRRLGPALLLCGSALVGIASCENRLDELQPPAELSPPSSNDDELDTIAPPLLPVLDTNPAVSFDASCSNQTRDGDETGPDCGGPDCSPCGLGLPCDDGDDCESGECSTFNPARPVCAPASCVNGELDDDENGVDCGGLCPGCPDESECTVDTDCASRICSDDGTCQIPACDDGVKNGLEGGPDCGSPESGCELCVNGVVCEDDSNCASTLCWAGTCADLSCDNQMLTGNETDVDCGGSCPPCMDTELCRFGEDCISGVCSPGEDEEFRCQVPECDDDVQNGDEGDVDCGGSSCDPCPDGSACITATDCASNVCRQAPGDDGVMCQPATCSDQVRNGDESAIDCGGDDCDPCPPNSQCRTADDCTSGECVSDACSRLGAGEDCSGDADCLSGSCDDGSCATSDVQQPCNVDADCLGDSCVQGVCQPVFTGGLCTRDAGCFSDSCLGGRCAVGSLSAVCQQDGDCASGECAGTCQSLGLSVESRGGDAVGTTVEVEFFLAPGSVPVRYDEIAVLYFFTNDFDDSALYVNFELDEPLVPTESHYVGLDDEHWVYVWHSTATDMLVGHRNYHQIRHDPWGDFDRTNDYSYVAARSANPSIVVCRNVGGTWGLAQGTYPADLDNPCQWVTSCDGATCVEPVSGP